MGSIPAPKAAHRGSSTRHTERAPAWIITDTMVRFSTSVCMAGTDTTTTRLKQAVADHFIDKMAHHLLLQVTGTFKNRAEFNDRVRRSIRSTDAAGVGTNNAVYLLMNQTDEENLPLLTRRLGERGLHVTAVPLDEQLRLISAAKQEASHA